MKKYKDYKNRGVGRDGYDALKSGRIGIGGVRTFHAAYASRQQMKGAQGAINYLAGKMEFEGRDDLEHVVGSPHLVEIAAGCIEATRRINTGPTAERLIITLTAELPLDFTRQQRSEAANKMCEHWTKRDHLAVVAVHCNDVVQPHIHAAISARPFRVEGEDLVPDRTPVKRPIATKASLRDERAAIANIINKVAEKEVFHPGRLADTGIARKAKRRVPMALYKAGVRELDPAVVTDIAESHKASREKSAEEIKKKKRQKRSRFDSQPMAQELWALISEEMVAKARARKEARAWKSRIKGLELGRAKALQRLSAMTKEIKSLKGDASDPAKPTKSQLSLVEDVYKRMKRNLPKEWWKDEKVSSEVWTQVRIDLAPRINRLNRLGRGSFHEN